MKIHHIALVFLLGVFICTAQTPEQQKMIEKGKKMQDSLMNTAMYKELLQINEQEEASKIAKKEKAQEELQNTKTSITTFQRKIDNYPFGSLDVNITMMPEGLRKPIEIGAISTSGELLFDFPKQLPEIPKEFASSESSTLWNTLFFQCDNGEDIITAQDNIFSFESSMLGLWTTDDRFVGVVFAVSDENLVPWVEDTVNMEPILGSFYELIYVAESFKYKGDCVSTDIFTDEPSQTTFAYNLNLKAGFNFIEYNILSIQKTDSQTASYPDKVTLTTVDGIPNCKWIARYF